MSHFQYSALVNALFAQVHDRDRRAQDPAQILETHLPARAREDRERPAAQSVTGDAAGELAAGLKVYLESGRFSRGRTEAGLVLLGNTSIIADQQPHYWQEEILR